MKHLQLNILWVALLFATGSQGQELELNFWDLGTQPHGVGVCAREGFNIQLLPGFPPELDDPWVYLFGTCKTFGGSVSCQKEEVNSDGEIMGQCLCNQLDDQEWDWDMESCVGKVGAICTAERTSFIPEKKCGLNSHCIPEQGEGYSVGRCECVEGYLENADRTCIPDPNVGDGDRGTPRTTTTTEAPDRGELELPLDLLIGFQFANYGEECHSEALLNKTYCLNYGETVACIDNQCQCNMVDDAVFDENLLMCVGLAGSYCLARRNLLGWKACIEGADCFLEDGTTLEEYSLGTCQCLYGHYEEADRTCTRNASIPNPSTKRPGPGEPPTSPITTTDTNPSTWNPTEPPGTTPEGGNDEDTTSPTGGATVIGEQNRFLVMILVAAIMSKALLAR